MTDQHKDRDLTRTLVARLKEMIVQQALTPGCKLPPERELARQFEVNRGAIRQAMKRLDVMGIVRQRAGDGTYLTGEASTTLNAPLEFLLMVDEITFAELFEARRVVEPELASRAATRRTAEELAALEASVEEMKHAVQSGSIDDIAANDRRFHELIWKAAGNRVFQRMFAPLHQTIIRGFAISSTLRDYDAAVAAHAGILEGIRNADPEKARYKMLEHLFRAESIIAGAR
jgi:GntR family transcriptional repressor for pyruvate dehydrogenase complex